MDTLPSAWHIPSLHLFSPLPVCRPTMHSMINLPDHLPCTGDPGVRPPSLCLCRARTRPPGVPGSYLHQAVHSLVLTSKGNSPQTSPLVHPVSSVSLILRCIFWSQGVCDAGMGMTQRSCSWKSLRTSRGGCLPAVPYAARAGLATPWVEPWAPPFFWHDVSFSIGLLALSSPL